MRPRAIAHGPIEEFRHVARLWRRRVGWHFGLDEQAAGPSVRLFTITKMRSEDSPATVKVLQIAMVLRVLERLVQVRLYLADLFQVIRNLEALHI